MRTKPGHRNRPKRRGDDAKEFLENHQPPREYERLLAEAPPEPTPEEWLERGPKRALPKPPPGGHKFVKKNLPKLADIGKKHPVPPEVDEILKATRERLRREGYAEPEYDHPFAENPYYLIRNTPDGKVKYDEFERILRSGKSQIPQHQDILLARQQDKINKAKRLASNQEEITKAAAQTIASAAYAAKAKARRLSVTITLDPVELDMLDALKPIMGLDRGRLIGKVIRQVHDAWRQREFENSGTDD